MLLSLVSHLGKLHGLANCEEWGTQDWGRESSRFVNKKLCKLRKIPTPEGHSISDPFRPLELAAAHKCLMRGKSLAFASNFLEFILHARLALKLGFSIASLPACANSKFQRSRQEHQ